MESMKTGLKDVLGTISEDPEVAFIFITELWPDIAGIELSRRTRPARLENSCLWIEVTDSEWRQPLSTLSQTLLSRIRQVWGVGGIERIRVETRLAASS